MWIGNFEFPNTVKIFVRKWVFNFLSTSIFMALLYCWSLRRIKGIRINIYLFVICYFFALLCNSFNNIGRQIVESQENKKVSIRMYLNFKIYHNLCSKENIYSDDLFRSRNGYKLNVKIYSSISHDKWFDNIWLNKLLSKFEEKEEKNINLN